MALERLSHIGVLKHIGFIEFACETPCGGEIDKDRSALLQFGLQPFGRERLPIAPELRTGGSNVGGVKFAANEINAARKNEHEHEHERDASLRCGCYRHNEHAFHPG